MTNKKPFTKKEREEIISSIRQSKCLATTENLGAALAWSLKNKETQPHFLINTKEGHVIIH